MNYKDIEYVVRARPGRDQWTFVISYPRSVSMPLIASLARMGSLATALVMHARSSQKAPAPWMLRPLGATWPRSTTGRLSELTGSAKARILKFRPAGQSRRVSFSHWQLNPRLSRAFFAALSHVLHFGMGSRSPFTSSSLCKMRCKPRLCIRIVWVPGVDETCSAGAQQSFYLLDRFATRSTPTKIGAIVQVTRIDPGMVFT
jgi:hypothetical protein